ncbi:MAG: hypothetical protein JSS03_02690 [Proteobacteria bacterium]|nr:hypothetical protein [Pseudomonadota bacterium]
MSALALSQAAAAPVLAGPPAPATAWPELPPGDLSVIDMVLPRRPSASLAVGVIGPGNVGRALLRQIAQVLAQLAQSSGIDLRVCAVANRTRMCRLPRGFQADAVDAHLAAGAAVDLDDFAPALRAQAVPHMLIVDCSGADAVADCYAPWLAAGIHVVTPSKHAGSGPLPRFAAITAARSGAAQFRYEASVGAGLPVIQTLRSMLDTGDELVGIEGVLSGTLAWLFNRYDGAVGFSELLREAMALGYTEPDPRDDLSGMDVARKLTILAREAGRMLTLADVQVENLVPEGLRRVSRAEFLARLGELDAPMHQRLALARDQGRALRHLARLDGHGAHVGLTAPAADHACMHTRATDNVIVLRTRRYADNPLVVQGPGAGPEVTAAGVFGDVLAIARGLR